MKERPILFSGPMVRALLSGAKTQTRRVVKNPREHFCDMNGLGHAVFTDDEITYQEIKCPYGIEGDALWVRETFGIGSENGTCHPADEEIFYRATDPGWDDEETGFRWKPSIFMPRWASRITLEMTGVKVERLQDISEEDARAEGVEQFSDDTWRDYIAANDAHNCCSEASGSFRSLWKSINGPDSWAANPWVWVIEFNQLNP